MPRLLFFRHPISEADSALFTVNVRHTRTRLGRGDESDIVLPDNEISRSHCLIDHIGGAWELVDRSSNGTFLNGERITRSALRQGDRVQVGGFVAIFEEDGHYPASPTEQPQVESRHEELVEVGEALTVSSPYLVILGGPGEGERFRLRGTRVSVGAFGSRVRLPDASLVRDHFRVRLYEGRTMLEPGQGALYLGNSRVRDIMPLFQGEEARAGATRFTVEWRTEQDTPDDDHFGEMVGTSAAMRRVFGVLRRIAAHHAPVLLLGESGTGKELAARALHDASPRAGRPFVAINCGAIQASLFNSELFGHEKGAFTGANERRDGAFHRADTGTLFLDEVGELPEDIQVALLRTLENGEVRRVGGADTSYPDVRVIAATNRNLVDQVRTGRFRQDLYFRLAVLAIQMPPLRERREDIPVIAQTIAKRINSEIHLSTDAIDALCAYDWPGNARELRNVLTRAFVMSGTQIDATSIVFQASIASTEVGVAPGNLDEVERDLVQSALRQAKGNRTAAARILGIPRTSLLYKLKRWGMEDEQV